jgi:hypothetical protein
MQVMSAGCAELKQWILRKNPEISDIELDLDIIECRLVDSLAFMDFVIQVSQLSGREIDFSNLDIEDFRTLRRMEERFFQADLP